MISDSGTHNQFYNELSTKSHLPEIPDVSWINVDDKNASRGLSHSLYIFWAACPEFRVYVTSNTRVPVAFWKSRRILLKICNEALDRCEHYIS